MHTLRLVISVYFDCYCDRRSHTRQPPGLVIEHTAIRLAWTWSSGSQWQCYCQWALINKWITE